MSKKDEQVRFIWPSGTQAELKANPYSEDHPQRIPTEEYFAGEIRKNITDVREGEEYSNLWLLITSLKNLENPKLSHGFDSWLWAIEAVLGMDTCKRIGSEVCKEMNFTLNEAEEIYNGAYREKIALGCKLNADATWDEIRKATEKSQER
jgi:hypothetical protein